MTQVIVHHTEGRNKYFQDITNSKLINPIFCGQESFNIEQEDNTIKKTSSLTACLIVII